MAGVFISEGDLVVGRALQAGYKLHSVLVDGARRQPMPEIIDDRVPIYAAGPKVLQKITGYHLHRGMLACFARRPEMTVPEVLEAVTTAVIIEGVNNPTNIGVILRCAAGLGIDGFLLDPTCCDPLYRRSGRVSMGEAYSLPYARLDAFPGGLDVCRENGMTLIALTPHHDAEPINELKLSPDEKIGLMLGAEGPGLSDGALSSADRMVKIPMSGTVDSINVGSAAAVAFYATMLART